MALRTLNVAVVVALISYGSIFFGLAASLVILGERLTAQDVTLLLEEIGSHRLRLEWLRSYAQERGWPVEPSSSRAKP